MIAEVANGIGPSPAPGAGGESLAREEQIERRRGARSCSSVSHRCSSAVAVEVELRGDRRARWRSSPSPSRRRRPATRAAPACAWPTAPAPPPRRRAVPSAAPPTHAPLQRADVDGEAHRRLRPSPASTTLTSSCARLAQRQRARPVERAAQRGQPARRVLPDAARAEVALLAQELRRAARARPAAAPSPARRGRCARRRSCWAEHPLERARRPRRGCSAPARTSASAWRHRRRRQPDLGGERLDLGRRQRLVVAGLAPLELGRAPQHELHLARRQPFVTPCLINIGREGPVYSAAAALSSSAPRRRRARLVAVRAAAAAPSGTPGAADAVTMALPPIGMRNGHSAMSGSGSM